MRKLIAVCSAAFVSVAVGLALPYTAHASTPCYYNVSSASQKVSLGNGQYLTQSVQVWWIPSSTGCTQWAGHDYGDTETEINVSVTSKYTIIASESFLPNWSWATDNANGESDILNHCGPCAWTSDNGRITGEYSQYANVVQNGPTDVYTSTPPVDMYNGSNCDGMTVGYVSGGDWLELQSGGNYVRQYMPTYFGYTVDNSC